MGTVPIALSRVFRGQHDLFGVGDLEPLAPPLLPMQAVHNSMHCPEIGAAPSQIDRGRRDRLVTVNSALPKASALDPQPVLGRVGVVSGRLYGVLMIA
jgi:hypothetical protein